MKFYDDPIPKKRRGKWLNEKSNSDQADADPSEDRRNYGIHCLNLGETAQELESDY